MLFYIIKKKFLIALTIITIFLFISCSQNKEQNIKARVSFLSSNGSTIFVTVVPENTFSGDVVTGALVLVTDSTNSVTTLDFDYQKQNYSGVLENSLNSDEYKVIIKSQICDDKIINVNHVKLQIKPSLTIFEDSSGNSVLKGKDLDCDLPIQIAWSSLGTNVVYRVEIQNGMNTVFSKSTQATTMVIPENILEEKSSYYLTITAHQSYGDIYFQKDEYYSSSSIKSSGFSFYAN